MKQEIPQSAVSANPRKVIERALLLPLIGLLLFIPPIAGIFDINALIAGIPFTVIYLFVVWGLLIISAYRLSRTLVYLDEDEADSVDMQSTEEESNP